MCLLSSDNIKTQINLHASAPSYASILTPKPTEPQKLYNSFLREDWPLNGLFLTSSILYQASIKCSDCKYKRKRYKGVCEMSFKKRYANHKKSFNIIKSKNDTSLSMEYWIL